MRNLLLIPLFICWMGLYATPAYAQDEPVEEPVAESVDEAAVPVETPVEAVEEPEAEVPAPVAEMPSEVTPGGLIEKIIGGVQNKNWMLVSCASILLIIWIWNVFIVPKVWANAGPKWKKASPYIAVALGAVAQFTAAVVAGSGWTEALNVALVTGFAASGAWSAAGKHTLGKLKVGAQKDG